MNKQKDCRQGFVEKLAADEAVIYQADRTTFKISRSALPKDVQEGCYVIETEKPGIFTIDYVITEKRQQELRRMSECYQE